MRFLADESCDFAAVRALRTAGHDVGAVSESTSRSEDLVVLARARDEHRILLTEGKDFGQLVYAAAHESIGVILIRFPADARPALPEAVAELVATRGTQLVGSFVVLEPGRVRIGRLPPTSRNSSERL
jgi:hypothetical protein